MNKIKKISAILCLVMAVLLLSSTKSYAATGNASVGVSSGTVNVGDRFTVTVNIAASEDMICQAILSYDPNLVRCEGYNGLINILDDGISSSKSFTYEFTALAQGNAGFTVSEIIIGTLYSNESITPGASSAGVSIVAPTQPALSSEANLTSLVTSLGQVDASAGSWTLHCSYETTTFAINPGVSAYATWSASGDFNNLKPGANQFVITVTAQDGVTKKSYPITVIRSETPAPTTTETEKETQTQTETESETETETALKLKVSLRDGSSLYAAESFAETLTLPDGFSETTQMVEGGYAAAAVNKAGLILLYLTDEQGENGAFYIYDSSEKVAYPFVRIHQPEKEVFIFLSKPEKEQIPEGYELKSLRAQKFTVEGYQRTDSEDENLYLVYGMNESGEIGWYRYDADNGSFFPYVEDGSVDEEGLAALTEQHRKEKEELETKLAMNRMLLCIFAAAAGVFGLLALILLIVYLNSRKKNYERVMEASEDFESFEPVSEEEHSSSEEQAQESADSLPEVKDEELSALVAEVLIEDQIFSDDNEKGETSLSDDIDGDDTDQENTDQENTDQNNTDQEDTDREEGDEEGSEQEDTKQESSEEGKKQKDDTDGVDDILDVINLDEIK